MPLSHSTESRKESEIEKAKKEKDVEYKTKEAEGLDRTLTESSSDKEGVQSERDAIHSYLGGAREAVRRGA